MTPPHVSFCCTWEREALETFGLPSIMLAGKAKPLMVTPGSFHVWSLSRVSNIPNYIMYVNTLTCINAQSHRLMNTLAGGIAPFC